MKILFLDFDGVILTLRTCLAHPDQSWSKASPDPNLCQVLRKVCDESGARIVVSSTWRSVEQLCHDKLSQGGLLEFLHNDWRTKDLGFGNDSRPKEIKEWLSRHLDVTDYFILDDDAFDWESPEQTSRWLQCCSENGMPAAEMRRLLSWVPAPSITLATEEDTSVFGNAKL